jgi:hypothetical protein
MILTCLVLTGLAACGCTSKSTAKADARAAYYAGQAQAMHQIEQEQSAPAAPGNTVSILGPVQYPSLTWTPDLTVTKAIVAAGYVDPGSPSQITVYRQHSQFTVDPQALLNGEDVALLPGDVLKLLP